MGNSPEHYFKTQKAISKIIGVILNGDFIQSYIRYTIIIKTVKVLASYNYDVKYYYSLANCGLLTLGSSLQRT